MLPTAKNLQLAANFHFFQLVSNNFLQLALRISFCFIVFDILLFFFCILINKYCLFILSSRRYFRQDYGMWVDSVYHTSNTGEAFQTKKWGNFGLGPKWR